MLGSVMKSLNDQATTGRSFRRFALKVRGGGPAFSNKRRKEGVVVAVTKSESSGGACVGRDPWPKSAFSGFYADAQEAARSDFGVEGGKSMPTLSQTT